MRLPGVILTMASAIGLTGCVVAEYQRPPPPPYRPPPPPVVQYDRGPPPRDIYPRPYDYDHRPPPPDHDRHYDRDQYYPDR